MMFKSKWMAITVLRCLWRVEMRDTIRVSSKELELMLKPEMALHFWGKLDWLSLFVIFLQKAWRFLLSPPSPSSLHMLQPSELHQDFYPNPRPSLLFSYHITPFEKRPIHTEIIVFNKIGKFMYIYLFWNINHKGQSIGHKSMLIHLNYNFGIKGKIHLGWLWIK